MKIAAMGLSLVGLLGAAAHFAMRGEIAVSLVLNACALASAVLFSNVGVEDE